MGIPYCRHKGNKKCRAKTSPKLTSYEHKVKQTVVLGETSILLLIFSLIFPPVFILFMISLIATIASARYNN